MSTAVSQREVRQPLQLGSYSVTLLPHNLPGIGARVFLVLDDLRMHEALNLSPDHARRIADQLKLAACEAEAMERRARRHGFA